MKKIAHLFENLSIIPVMVAVINSWAFYILQNDKVNYLGLLILAGICWCVYTYDGIKDLRLFPSESTSNRHKFIEKHQFNLSVIMIAIGVIVLILLFFQNQNLLLFGSFTGILLFLYFILINKYQKFRVRKEFLMPIIFTLAVCGVPLSQKSSINLSSWFLGFSFLILVVQNAFLNSWFEQKITESASNIYSKLSLQTGLRIVNLCNVILILSYVIFFSNGSEFKNNLALTYMIISLLVSFSATKSHLIQKKYRLVLDTLLLLSLFAILFYGRFV